MIPRPKYRAHIRCRTLPDGYTECAIDYLVDRTNAWREAVSIAQSIASHEHIAYLALYCDGQLYRHAEVTPR